jgi:hypothetical protein
MDKNLLDTPKIQLAFSHVKDAFSPLHEDSKNAHLGIIVKSSSTQERRGLQSITENEKNPAFFRVERFILQSAVRHLFPKSTTAKCLRALCPNCSDVKVFQSINFGTTHYVNLQICSSVWSCPVCSIKISERRRLEVQSAMQQHESSGGQVLLLTLTNPHYTTDFLPNLLKRQALAMSRFKGNRSAKKLFASVDCIGSIRAWEVTHSDKNGWHPHFHLLLFVRSGLDLEELQNCFYKVWANCCRLAKLPIPSLAHGVRLDDGSKAAEYVSKGTWGLDSEMTKGHIKKGVNGGLSPFDLLRLYAYNDDKCAGALFCEYAKAFKGNGQLVWSPGLKALFAINDKSDKQVASSIDEHSILLGSIELKQWRLVLRFDSLLNSRSEILERARDGWERVERYLIYLENLAAN